MRVLTDRWEDGFLDYHLGPGQVRIKVHAWLRLHEIKDAYVYPTQSLANVMAYSLDIGPVQTFRKILSRREERIRNLKFVSAGLGRVMENNSSADFDTGDPVAFVAPFHPPCVDQLCLSSELVKKVPELPAHFNRPDTLLEGSVPSEDRLWMRLSGWNSFSGRTLDAGLLGQAFAKIETMLLAGRQPEGMAARPAPPRPALSVSEFTSPSSGRKKAALFGLGHYAKNMILPRIKPYLDVAAIYEVDPTQIARRSLPARFSTASSPEGDEKYEVFLIAGFNHTHTPLAITAVSQGAVAMVEKPLATSHHDLDRLVGILSLHQSKIFIAFQRRYSPLSDMIKRDLQVNQGTPVSCRCVVYEIPLPANHWYLWPNSGGRIISNGCHWIDHFLYMNSFAKPERVLGAKLKNDDYQVVIDLENGASFTMTITDHGASRLGVRDYCHYTVNSRTATIIDGSHYRAETTTRFLAKTAINKMAAYDRMYDRIGRMIKDDQPGDSVESIEVSSRTILQADEQVRNS